MQISFSKYQGAGNDFIMIADPKGKIEALLNTQQIAHLCHRRFGVGADGLILLQKCAGYNFRMVYYNSDGKESSMCGNGGRCIVAFAARVGWVKKHVNFLAVDGAHKALIRTNVISLQMQNVTDWGMIAEDWVLNTGSPHYVRFVGNLAKVEVKKEGQAVRYSEQFAKEGVNVNFAEINKKSLKLATYERGVEDETWACGTGAVASVIAANVAYRTKSPVVVHTKGGELKVKFEITEKGYENIWLEGEAKWVFDGEITIV